MANEGGLLYAADVSARVGRSGGHHSVVDNEQPTPFGVATADSQNDPELDGPTRRRRPTMRRLNLNLPVTLYDDLSELAESQGKSMTEIVRTGLGLAHIAYTQLGKQRKLLIADNDGNTIREILIPW